MKRTLFSFSGAFAAALLLVACGDQNMETGAPAANETEAVNEGTMGQHTVTTNLQDDAVPSEPGAGAAVGGNPAGAGTSELRDEGAVGQETPRNE